MRVSKRLLRLLAVLLAFVLVAAACGDDDDESSSTSTEEGAAEEEAAAEEEEGAAEEEAAEEEMAEEDAAAAVSGSVNVSGSSTVEPISTRVKELFNESVGSDVEITVNGPGTSAGFKEFCPGNTDINDASRTIKDTELEDCVDHVELRVAFDGIAIMVNPANPLECVNLTDLYAISGPESEGNTWEEAAAFAAELGSSSDPAGWPTGTVEVIAPGTESGTYGSYIEIVLEGLGEERLEAGEYEAKIDENGDPVLIRTDFAGQPDDNVIIEGIASTEGAYGWVGFAFAQAAGDAVKVLDVFNEDLGECVSPSLETIADGSYPVSRSLYIYVNTAKAAENLSLIHI